MNILVTAGNTQTPIDRVRCIANVFSGKTGARIAARAFDRGHTVSLLTSHPEVLAGIPAVRPRVGPDWAVHPYRTFDDLDALMGERIAGGGFDAVIHAAAVSDFRVAGVFESPDGESVPASGKVKSRHPVLWVKLVPTPKLVDKVRGEWGFTGRLVKFKLEVGVSERELLTVAEQSRLQSEADVMCANTLEGMHDWAYLGAGADYARIPRSELPDRLIDAVEGRIPG